MSEDDLRQRIAELEEEVVVLRSAFDITCKAYRSAVDMRDEARRTRDRLRKELNEAQSTIDHLRGDNFDAIPPHQV